MDINVLVLNVGNSRLAMGAFAAGELGEVTRVPHGQRRDWPRAIAQAWARVATREGAAVVAAGVNPALVEPLEHAIEQVTGRRTLWVGREVELPIRVLTDAPQQTGVDRVLNVAAAYEQMQKACAVVDAGTA